MRKINICLGLLILLAGCSAKYDKTVAYVERERMMGTWYVVAGRFSPEEKKDVNTVENFTWNESEKRIDIEFSTNKGGPGGKLVKYPLKAWIVNDDNAHWKVQRTWPFKSDYIVIGLGSEYTWAAIGVPDQEHLWILSRVPAVSREAVDQMISNVKKKGYDTSEITYVDHYE